ncbi:MAG: hypothetical protein VB144_15345 [Clostridia bacterium]|nr:hypothetical protein [Clostridia bacterium]
MEFAKRRAKLNARPLCRGYQWAYNDYCFLLLGDVLAVQPLGGGKTDFVSVHDGQVIDQLEGEAMARLGPDAILIEVSEADVYLVSSQGGGIRRIPLKLEPGHVCNGGCGSDAGVLAVNVIDKSRPDKWPLYTQLIDMAGEVLSVVSHPDGDVCTEAMSPDGRYVLAMGWLGRTYEGRVYDCAQNPPEVVFRGRRGGPIPILWLPGLETRRFLAMCNMTDCGFDAVMYDIDAGNRKALMSSVPISGWGALSPDGKLLPLWPQSPKNERGAVVMRCQTGEMMHTGIIYRGGSYIPFVWTPSSRRALIQHRKDWYDPSGWPPPEVSSEALSVMDLGTMEITQLDLDVPVGKARAWVDENRFVFIGGFMRCARSERDGLRALMDDHIYLADLSEAVPV